MTDHTTENQYAIGGTAQGAMTKDEITNTRSMIYAQPGLGLKEMGAQMVSSLEWSFNSMSDTEQATKYRADPNALSLGGGSFSLVPVMGRFIFGNSENDTNTGNLRIDQKSSHLCSSCKDTTIGSTNIDTVDGKEMNPLGSTIPSTHFSPAKTWVKKLFPVLWDKKFYQIAFLEAVQVLLLRALKGTKTEQNRKETAIDLGTYIVDNQEIEDRILADARS